jgi:ABC-type transport system substrate-binding protein
MNLKDDLLKNIKVRQALSLAVDRGGIVEAEGGIAKPVFGPYPFDEGGGPSSSTEERLEAARGLLAEAGWIVASNRDVRIKKETAKTTGSTAEATASSTELALTITVPDVPDLIAVAETLKRQWSLLGAKINVAVESSPALYKRATEDRNVQLLVWNVRLTSSQDLSPLWRSGAAENRGRNLSNLVDRAVDAALDAVTTATSTDGEREARMKLSETILSKVPAVFLARPAYGYVYSTHIHGIGPAYQLGTPSDRFQDIANWYVKTRWTWR